MFIIVWGHFRTGQKHMKLASKITRWVSGEKKLQVVIAASVLDHKSDYISHRMENSCNNDKRLVIWYGIAKRLVVK